MQPAVGCLVPKHTALDPLGDNATWLGSCCMRFNRECLQQVKKVSDGSAPDQSCLVHGLACRKNLTHRRMRKHITNPRILLLASRLESHRTQNRLASFDHYTNDQVCLAVPIDGRPLLLL